MDGVSSRRANKKDAAGEVWQMLMQFAQAQWMQAAGKLQKIGLTPGHLKLLMLLEPGVARPMGALAQEFACDASTMTWLVDRLEERALVERRSMPGDRRVKAVALTRSGAEMKRKAQERLFQPPAALANLDRETLEGLRAIFIDLSERPEIETA